MARDGTRLLDGKKIGIFGKGGAGKSTVTALFAASLRDRGYRVAILDADSTNVGLAEALGFDRQPDALIDRYGGMVFSGGAVTCPVDDPTPLPDADLDLSRLEERYVLRRGAIDLLMIGKIGHLGPGAGCDGPIAKIARDLRVLDEGRLPVTLVDFKAGFEDSARGVLTGLDWAIVVVDPTLAAVRMAGDLRRTVGSIRSGALPATRHLDDPGRVRLANDLYRAARIEGLSCVLNKLADRETETTLRELLEGEGLDCAAVVPYDAEVSSAWLRGRPVESTRAVDACDALAERLERSGAAHRAVTG